MTSKTYILTTALLTACTMSWSQQLTGRSEYSYDDATQLWHLTDNAAGLGIDTTRNRGVAEVGYDHQSGSYHRVQEGSRSNEIHFATERYQKIGKYLYGYGRFDFDAGRLQERAWCDVRRPYHSNPFFPGSAIAGKYDNLDFRFVAAVGTKDFGRWHFGMRLDYDAGDLSRLRDPRSRSLLLDYKLTPSLTYTFGHNTLGLSANYHRRKEKITGITTLQTDAVITYYTMSGMEHAQGTVSGYSGYQREWVDHRFGATLSYAYRNDGYNQLTTASVERGSEHVYGQYEYEDGLFVDYRYALDSHHRLRSGRLLHEADLSFAYEQAYADEYRQKYNVEHSSDVQTKDYTYTERQPDGTLIEKTTTITKTSDFTSYYYTNLLTFKKRFQVRQCNVALHYRLNFLHGQRVGAYVGTSLSADYARDKHLLPSSSLRYTGYDVSLEGGYGLLKGRLWVESEIRRHVSGSATLDLSDATTDYAASVLIPDMNYYRANYWQGRLELLYQLPLTIKKKRTCWFVKAYGSYLHTDNSLNGRSGGVAVGLYY